MQKVNSISSALASMESQTYMQEIITILAEPAAHCVFIKNEYSKYDYANQNFLTLLGINSVKDLHGQSDSAFCKDKTLVNRYLNDDAFVLGNEKVLSLSDKVKPKHNAPIEKTMTGKLYPLFVDSNRCNFILGIVSPVNKLIRLDWDAVFNLDKIVLDELLIKKSYKIQTCWGDISFSRREIEVLIRLLRGHHAGEIAASLALKQTTVESYIASIKNKAGVSSKTELIDFVVAYKLLEQIAV